MEIKPQIQAVKYEELGVAILSLSSSSHTNTLLSLIPPDYSTDLILVNGDPHISQDTQEQLEQYKLPYEIIETFVSVWFGRKLRYTLLRLTISYDVFSHFSKVDFLECSDSYYSFVLSNKSCISPQMYSEMFDGKGNYMRHGKRWLSWVSESLIKAKCEYMVIPDIEDQLVYVGILLDKLGSWQPFFKEMMSKIK
jgi:hypothetical protein